MAEIRSKTKNQYDPSKNYKWEPTDQFFLSGAEFDVIFKALRTAATHPDFQRIVTSYEALKVAEQIFKDGVEAGVIQEVNPEPRPKKAWHNTEIDAST